MARLPALIDAIVGIDGRDRATIEHTARVIRELGYIPTTKRGSGASAMTSKEAVNLLLALNGASTPKQAPDAVKRLRQFRCKKSKPEGVGPLRSLSEISDFAEALECLIDSFPRLAAFFEKDVARADAYFFDDFAIGIEIHYGYATICVKGRHRRKQHSFSRNYHLPFEAIDFSGPSPDRRVVIFLSGQTIFTLWHCVYDGRPRERG